MSDANNEERRVGRDEMNLTEFPITTLAERVPPGIKTLVFEDQYGDRSNPRATGVGRADLFSTVVPRALTVVPRALYRSSACAFTVVPRALLEALTVVSRALYRSSACALGSQVGLSLDLRFPYSGN
jgi:hypothetical protein